MIQRIFSLGCALGLASVLPIGVAHAQPAAVDKDKAKTAKQYVDAGLAAQSAKDYDTAVTLYKKAYELVPHPVLLFNIGQAHRLAGQMDDAVAYYQRYLAADPNGPQAATARDLIAEIAATRAAAAKKIDDARKADEARKADDARKAEDTRNADAARKREAADVAQSTAGTAATDGATATDGADAHPGRSLRLAGIAAGGAGVVAVGVSIMFALRSGSISDELSQPGAMFSPGRVDDGEAAERNAILFGVAGGALIAGGAIAYVLGHRQGATQTEHVSVQLRPGFAGFAISGVLP